MTSMVDVGTSFERRGLGMVVWRERRILKEVLAAALGDLYTTFTTPSSTFYQLK